MGYYAGLSLKYMGKHWSRTIYSVFGILLTFMLVFAVLTTGYSLWDYALDVQYAGEYGETQLNVLALLTKEEVKWADRHASIAELVIFDMTVPDNEDVRQVSLDELTEGHYYNTYIGLKDTSDLRKSAAMLQDYLGYEVTVNEDVELYLGQGDSLTLSLYNSIVVILGGIFAVFSILIIRNIMMISVVERIHDYGLMRCVGMSRKQLTMLLATEGMLMGICGAIGGIGCGYGFLQAFAGQLNKKLTLLPTEFHVGFYPKALIYTTLICLVTIFYALLEPARQAGLVSPIDAVCNNITLRNRKGGMREKFRYHSGRLWGMLFGAPGEYAYKNMLRNRGRFIYLFMGMLVCMTLVGSVYSFSDSAVSTLKKQYQGQNWEFAEYISMNGAYSDELYHEICSDLRNIDGVLETGILLMRQDYMLYDPGLSEQNLNWCLQLGYDESHFDRLKPYLTEGEISYEKMKQENGIILCDSKYNVRDENGDFTSERITSYHVGDTISMLSAEGYAEADRIYREAVNLAARNKDIRTFTRKGEEEKIIYTPENYNSDCPGFKKLLKETLRLLKEQGYDCEKLQDVSEYKNMYALQNNLSQLLYQEGMRDDYVIQGIVSENIFYGVGEYGSNVISLLMPDAKFYPVLSEPSRHGPSYLYSWSIGLTRDINKLNNAVSQYCKEKSTDACSMYYTDSSTDYLNNTSTILEITKIVAAIVGGCIALISMIQIFNTVCASMSLRQKELWLYEMVGMSRRQKRWMIILENSSSSLLAILAGFLLSRGITWYFVEHLLNQDNFIQYTYPVGKNLLLAAVLLGMAVIASLLGQTSSSGRQK